MVGKFPRGTLPPSVFQTLARRPPEKVEPPPTTVKVEPPPTTVKVAETAAQQGAPPAAESPRETSDLASTCPTCGTLMQPEHAHYRCLTCGYRDSCCF